MPEPGPSHYEVLHVPVDASAADIARAYRTQAKLAHPDAGGDPARFRRIVLAYEELRDADRRRAYNERAGIRLATTGTQTRAPNGGWAGAKGTFTGDVEFPAYLRDITDSPWRPREEEPPPPAPTGVDPVSPTAPAEVRWWWPQRAVAPPVSAGPLLLVSAPDSVVALSSLTGHEAWHAALGAPLQHPVVVAGDTVVAWDEAGQLHGLELGRGVTRWQRPLGAPGPGGLARHGPLVVAAGADATLTAIDPTDGSTRWTARLAGPASAPLAVMPGAEQVVAVTDRGRTVEAVETRRGRHRWRLTLRTPVELPPCAVADTIWLAGGGPRGSLVRLDGVNGAVAGTFRAGSAIAGMATDHHLLYASVAGPSRVLGVDGAGRVHLAVDTPQVCPEPAIAPDHAYVADPAGRLLAIDLADGTITGAANLAFDPLGAPQLVGDSLVLLARDGRLWATGRPGPITPTEV